MGKPSFAFRVKMKRHLWVCLSSLVMQRHDTLLQCEILYFILSKTHFPTHFVLTLLTFSLVRPFSDREVRFQEQFLNKYNQQQIRTLTEIVERLLFANAKSCEEYADTSTLDDRIRYIVVRFLKRKLRIRKEKLWNQNHTNAARDKERLEMDLSEVNRALPRMSIRPTVRTTSRSKSPSWLREKKMSTARTWIPKSACS